MNEPRTILVSGATGTVGRHVTAGLTSRGVRVRALTRDPAAADLPARVEAVPGSPFDPAGLEPWLDGVSGVFLMLPRFADIAAVRETVRVIARHAEHVVFLSSGAVRDGVPATGQSGAIARAHAEVEEAIRDSGIAWTFLRPYRFAANILRWGEAIRAGAPVPVVLPHVPVTLLDERDIAAVAVHALTEDGHAGARYELTGPEPLTPVRQLAIIGEVTGRRIAWTERPAEDWIRTVLGRDATDAEVAGMRANIEDSASSVTDTITRVTGRPARTFREWVFEHTHELTGPLPELRRDDAGFVLASTWRVADPARQRAAAAAALDDWRDRPWPPGLLAHSVLLGTDGHTLLHYSQWTDSGAVEAFRRAGRTRRNDDIDAVVSGIERLTATGYRRYRSAVPDRPIEPGMVVLVSFATESAAVGARFVDALLTRHPVNTGERPPDGMGGNHFHLAVDGSRVLNYAEFTDEAAHQRVVDTRLRAGDDVPGLIAGTPGLTPLGFERFLPYGTRYGRG
ncbi:hypothetical protein DI005_26155 [Prauserella sp. PE36]|uniref:SDR family oxidoreductase n=1 Tax=Prauserella sp. PE36 TaxID=1504709 RepID=UPI000DE4A338|nr:NAD(P)H-binding protein [Prauserella sp. PE36]RBM16325.1 hypothetical protein DI005_26155 [Prauserella sp. PE36]